MPQVIIIFGYNNTRLHDIERIKLLAKNKFNAEIMLCKDQITQQDTAVSPYTFSIPLEVADTVKIEKSIQRIDNFLLANHLEVIGGLPFSDRGIPVGSAFAQSRNLTSDSSIKDKAFACINKLLFRQLEQRTASPQWYKKPVFAQLRTIEDAYLFVKTAKRPLLLKPVAEGNSRGCLRINTLEDLDRCHEVLLPYFKKEGVLAEECIQGYEEFSFDGVANRYVITQKKVLTGQYPVEIQHLVPAALSSDDYNRLLEAGLHVAQMTGSNGGAVHHEFFFNKQTKEVYCVEPNRRPAGMNIWDLIQQAFPEYNFWEMWLEWAVGINPVIPPVKHQYYAGCHKLIAQASGRITQVDETAIKAVEAAECLTVKLTKAIGEMVEANPRDNSQVLGYVTGKSPSMAALIQAFEKAADSVQNAIKLALDLN